MFASQTPKHDYIVAIDPDVERSGLAVLYTPTKDLTLQACAFPQLVEQLAKLKEEAQCTNGRLLVIVEDSWSRGSNWHINQRMGMYKIAAIGESVGRCHEVGILTLEFCRHMGIEAKGVPPLPLHAKGFRFWSGHEGKITHKEFCAATGFERSRTNQEERDAGLLAWHYAGLPIQAKLKNRV